MYIMEIYTHEDSNRMIGQTLPAPALPVVLLSALLLSLTGCASLSDRGCEMQEARARTADLSTHYRPSTPQAGQNSGGPLPKGVPMKAMHYAVGFNVAQIEPCTTLSIIKKLTLQKSADTDILIKETREFYAEDGTLITSLTEDITTQFPKSGTYAAVTPLPIPRAAPIGKYLIVSKLTLERSGEKRPLLLSTARASFTLLRAEAQAGPVVPDPVRPVAPNLRPPVGIVSVHPPRPSFHPE